MQRSQTTGFYDTFAQTQAVACIYAGSSSDSFLLTGLACVCSVGERERGGTLTPGRAFSLRSDRAESSRGVGPPATEKENPPFFIVKDAVECDGLISKGPGRGISERKGPAKATEGKGESRKRFPPIASNSLVLNENMRMNLSRPCRLQRALPSARAQPAWSCGFTVAFSGPGGGTAEVNLSLYSVFEEEAECIFGDSHSGLLRLEESGLQKSELRQVFQPSSSSFSSSFLSQIEASSSAGKPQVVKMLPHINRSYLLLVTLGIFVMRLHLSASALDTFFFTALRT